jgi:hypothetical protein
LIRWPILLSELAKVCQVYLETAGACCCSGFQPAPLLLVFGTLSFWLRQHQPHHHRLLSWVGLAYGFKWVWAPLVDRLPIPLLTRLGRRRSWLLLARRDIVAALVGMALTDRQALLPVVTRWRWRLVQPRKTSPDAHVSSPLPRKRRAGRLPTRLPHCDDLWRRWRYVDSARAGGGVVGYQQGRGRRLLW